MDAISDLSPEAGVAIGIIVGLLSTCVQSVGLTMQRKSHMLEDEKINTPDDPHRPAYRRRRWQIGMCLFLLANIVGSTIQITTLPLPLLSTLQASGLVFNSLLATLLLKESFTWRTGGGTLLVAGGAVLISLFSAVPEPSHNLKQLLSLLRRRDFLLWFLLSLVFVCIVLIMDFTMRKCTPERRGDIARFRLIRGMSYGMISGILSAHALLLAKSAVELIVRSVADHQNQFASYQPWLLVVAFVILALSQLYYLHLGLKLVSTSILYPFVFCIYNIVAILDGLIYFRQMDQLPPLHAGLIGLGTFILLAGVLALSWRISDANDGDEPQMASAEIPQTLLVPGSGFVADPEDDDIIESADASGYDTDEEGSDERANLVRKGRPRSRTTGSRTTPSPFVTGKRRRRAHTLRDVSKIWHDQLSEDGSLKPIYGTFMPQDREDSIGRPLTLGGHEASSGGTPIDEPDDDDIEVALEGSLLRSQTMPNPARSKSSRRRRRKSGYENGALFSDMLRRDWWRIRRKRGDDDENYEEDDDLEEAIRPESSGRRSSGR